MKAQALWQVSVTTLIQAEDATAALLERIFGQPPSIYVADGGTECVATIYSAENREQVEARRQVLAAELKAISSDLGRPRILTRRVPREDWATSWKKHFKPLAIGSALLIKPSWSKRKPRPNQAVVILDPGLSFGTGQHPTTAFCLEQLVASRKPGQPRSFLDLGTGSGILAIAAAKLGYSPIRALDNDPTAVRVAEANAGRNRVSHKIIVTRQDLATLPVKSRTRFDLVCANLVADLHILHVDRIVNRLAPGGKLVLAGLLTAQFTSVTRVYADKGLIVQVSRAEREWKSGALVWK